MKPIWEKRDELLANPDEVMDIDNKGSIKAAKAAEETMKLVREAMFL